MKAGDRPLTFGDVARHFGVSYDSVARCARLMVDTGVARPAMIPVCGTRALHGRLPSRQPNRRRKSPPRGAGTIRAARSLSGWLQVLCSWFPVTPAELDFRGRGAFPAWQARRIAAQAPHDAGLPTLSGKERQTWHREL
jgi:hypothetical protein